MSMDANARIRFCVQEPMLIHFDNNFAHHMPKNYVYHEQTKHIEVNYHFIQKESAKNEVVLKHTHTTD